MSTKPRVASPMPPTTSQQDSGSTRRSSSLSEIVDPIEQGVSNIVNSDGEKEMDGNDTEAETERLEDSPFKNQRHQSVLLSSANVEETYQNERSLSEASSAAASSEDEIQHLTPSSSPRKRKRSHLGRTKELPAPFREDPPLDAGDLSRTASPHSDLSHGVTADQHGQREADESESDSESNASSTRLKLNAQIRTSKLADMEDLGDAEEAGDDENAPIEGRGRTVEAEDSNLDEVDGYDAGDADADADNLNKSQEELANKRLALDSLTSLEKCFATLRDKLFDERLAATNAELGLLQKPGFAHAELLAMREAIDNHRQRKIKYQQTFLKYKLQTLQRETIAGKHQIQSQYMQTARDARDRALDDLNNDFYQVQRERRKGDYAVPDSLFLFQDDRSQQIRQQMAYNKEISIMSGLAKYVGFPAAPRIQEARPHEVEEDMRNMGIATQAGPILPARFTAFRSVIPAQSSSTRQAPSAEENFLEKNAWANPQHPAHQLHRQRSQATQMQYNNAIKGSENGNENRTIPQVATFSITGQPGESPSEQVQISEHPVPHGHPNDIPSRHRPNTNRNEEDSSKIPTARQSEILGQHNSAQFASVFHNRAMKSSTPPTVQSSPTLHIEPAVDQRNLSSGTPMNQSSTSNTDHNRQVTTSPRPSPYTGPSPAMVAGTG